MTDRTSAALPTRDEIRQTLRLHLPELARRYSVVNLRLFGSTYPASGSPAAISICWWRLTTRN
jgi:hypothetical protein